MERSNTLQASDSIKITPVPQAMASDKVKLIVNRAPWAANTHGSSCDQSLEWLNSHATSSSADTILYHCACYRDNGFQDFHCLESQFLWLFGSPWPGSAHLSGSASWLHSPHSTHVLFIAKSYKEDPWTWTQSLSHWQESQEYLLLIFKVWVSFFLVVGGSSFLTRDLQSMLQSQQIELCLARY